MVRGNHEDKFIRYHQHQKRGGKNPMKLNDLEESIYAGLTPKDMEFLNSLPIFLQHGRLTIVHAGVLPSTNLYNLTKKEAAKVMRVRYLDEEGRFVSLDEVDIREHFYWSELYDGRYGFIVYGHQPFLNPRVDRFCFGIDTGAVYGNKLTAVVFKGLEYRFVDVKSPAYAKSERGWEITDL